MASAGALVVAQQNSIVPQPRAEALPAPGTGSPKVSRTVPKPEAVMPTVPAGFTVTTYAELPSAAHDGLRAERRSLRQLARRPTPSSCCATATTTAGSKRAACLPRVILRVRGGEVAACRRHRRWQFRRAAQGRSRIRMRHPRPLRRLQRRSAGGSALAVPRQVAAHRALAARRHELAARWWPRRSGRCSAPTRPRACRRRSSCRRARANCARRSASHSMTAISTSATPPRSFATSIRTAI